SEFTENAPEHSADKFRIHELSSAFVNGHDASDVQRIVRVLFVSGKDLELRMHDLQLTAKRIDLDFSVQSHLDSRHQHVLEPFAMEPFAEQHHARAVPESRFKDGHPLPDVAQFDRAHLRNYRGHLARCKLSDRLHVAAVFVTERWIGKQILDCDQT